MKTSVQNDIKVPKSGFKRSKFNWSHDINSTFGWGEVQPTECKLLVPNSKTVVNNKGLIRFAPMLSPTFGRVRYKSFSQFVPLEDIYPNFGSMMSQEPKSTANQTQVATKLVNIPLCHLSSWAFMGARATVYFAIQTNDGKTAEQNAREGNYITWYRQNNKDDSTQSDWQMYFDKLQNYSGGAFYAESDSFNNASNHVLPSVDCVTMDLSKLGANIAQCFTYSTPIRLSAKNLHDLCPVRRDYEPNVYAGEVPLKSYQREVTFDSADYVFESYKEQNNDSVYFAIAFEFSDFGKRIRKIIQGCGYQLNLTNPLRVSMLPLLAQYKAYFDVFGLTLYQSWETTWCAKFIKYMENYFLEDFDFFAPRSKSQYSSLNDAMCAHVFMLTELADEWYTERPDFYGANIQRLGVSPKLDTSTFISVSSSGRRKVGTNVDVADDTTNNDGTAPSQNEGYTNDSQGTLIPNNIPYINQLQHSWIDLVILQRMGRWINKYTVLGRVFDKLMRAFGFGKYLDMIDSKFIGNTDRMLTISDVVSFADTERASLGEYGGKGLEYFEEGKQVFENDVFGYWVTLSCVVPEAGYTQNIDLTLPCVKKADLYQADFDAVGMEATTKQSLVASSFIGTELTATDSVINTTFGFVPRSSKWKVHKNLVNGDFNRHGLRSVYLPFTLDKQLNINDFDVSFEDYRNPQGAVFYNFVKLEKSKKVTDLPIAGNWARTPTKYKWLGHFDRIFRLEDSDVSDSSNVNLVQLVGFSDFNRDNFMFHCISSMTCWAPMKPIEESYGLEEEENPNQSGVEYVNKA